MNHHQRHNYKSFPASWQESTSASESPAELPSPSALGSGDPIATGHLAARGAPSRKPQNLARVQKVYLHWVAKNRAALTWFERHFDDVSREQMAGNRVCFSHLVCFFMLFSRNWSEETDLSSNLVSRAGLNPNQRAIGRLSLCDGPIASPWQNQLN